MIYYGSRMVVAQFAKDLLSTSEFDFQSITITQLVTSEDCSVRIVTDASSVDIVKMLAQIYSVALLNTSPPNTPDG